MKHFLLTILFACLSLLVSAQITVTNSTFPVEGDTLTTTTAMSLVGFTNSGAGPNQIWNFQNLSGTLPIQVIFFFFDSGTQSAAFPDADLFIETGAVGESYFKSTSTEFSTLGFAGGDPSGFGLDLTAQFSQPYVIRRAPMTYEPDITRTTTTDYSFRLAFDDLPNVLTDSLADLPFALDSIGIKIVLTRMDRVDAWGTMNLPNGNFEVLREAGEEIVDTRIEAKLPFFGWTDITNQIPGGLGAGIDTTYTFSFFNNVEKEPIAILTTEADRTTILDVEYKYIETTSDAKDLLSLESGFYVFPNPAILSVNLDIVNFEKDEYTFKLFNILGMKVYEKDIHHEGKKTKSNIDLRNFKKGTYLYSLTNSKGKILGTKRLMILRP